MSSQSSRGISFETAYSYASRTTLSQKEADQLVGWFGSQNAEKGNNPRQDDLKAVFVLKSSARDVVAKSDDGSWKAMLHKVGDGVFAASMEIPQGSGFHWHYEADGVRVGGGDLESYIYPEETKPHEGGPKGVLSEWSKVSSQIYPGVTRQMWVYVPAGYDGSKPANLLVVQDAQWARGYWTPVLDNMGASKEIPQTIAVFLTPGTKTKEIDNRSIEYDTVSDTYVTMLEKEILPLVYAKYNIRKEAAYHTIAGLSSGGICAFNAAWQRPDLFGKVISWIGSFTNLQGGPTGVAGGNTYPAIIRDHCGWDKKGEPKPIRVFLQDGSNDLDNKAGNWPLSNQQMAKALAYGGYDFRFELGHGFHSDKQGRSLLPSTLRWIWRDLER